MRKRGLGALLVLKRDADPSPVAAGMRPLDAKLSSGLIVALFEKRAPCTMAQLASTEIGSLGREAFCQ